MALLHDIGLQQQSHSPENFSAVIISRSQVNKWSLAPINKFCPQITQVFVVLLGDRCLLESSLRESPDIRIEPVRPDH